MNGKESNQGYIDMHTPYGMALLVFGFILLVSFIGAGAAIFKIGMQRDREVREELKRKQLPPKP